MPSEAQAFSKSVEELVERIRDWYDADLRGFRTLFTAAVDGVERPPKGTPEEVYYDWSGKGIKDLCEFLQEWYCWEPDVTTGLDYIEKFSWLNYRNDAGMVFVTTGQGLRMTYEFTMLQGAYMDSKASADLARKWVDQLGPERMADFKVPARGFRTFNQFFAREVKPKARPISAPDDDSVAVAPADCVINMIVDHLTDDTQIPVKTVAMNVKTLLNGSEYAKEFVGDEDRPGGTAVSCILLPDTYHWYHSPVAGQVVEASDSVAGVYYGMRDFPELLNDGNVGYGYDYSMFEHFRRGYLVIETEEHGYVGMVPVGLNSIASVRFEDRFRDVRPGDEKVPVAKGERIGKFLYGGSLNILLFQSHVFPAVQLLQGQRIGPLGTPGRPTSYFTGHRRAWPQHLEL